MCFSHIVKMKAEAGFCQWGDGSHAPGFDVHEYISITKKLEDVFRYARKVSCGARYGLHTRSSVPGACLVGPRKDGRVDFFHLEGCHPSMASVERGWDAWTRASRRNHYVGSESQDGRQVSCRLSRVVEACVSLKCSAILTS